MNENTPSAKGQIRSLLLVLFSGLAAGVIALAYLIYFYGPSGSYNSSNILIDPGYLSYVQVNEGNNNKFTFHKIEFTFQDMASSGQKEWKTVQLSESQYAKLFDLLKGKTSLADTVKVEPLFDRSKAPSMVIFVKGEVNRQPTIKVFEEVQYSPNGNFFRIRAPGRNNFEMIWAYFESDGVLQKSIQAIKTESSP